MKTGGGKRKPEWLERRPPSGKRYLIVRDKIKTLDLHTVCQEAHCPNVGECWGAGTATILIMGEVCTRGCRFCSVRTGNPGGKLDSEEPHRVARAVVELGLEYVVLTSVDRDDLPDGGSAHFAKTIRLIKEQDADIRVEALIPDFGGDAQALEVLVAAGSEVVAHNIEVVRRLTPLVRDRRADFNRSLELLSRVKDLDKRRLTKSSIMVGLGESEEELIEALAQLRARQVDILTIGQYLRPSPRHLAVDKYYLPEEFKQLEALGREAGVAYVAAGPLVRSSYRAGELFVKGVLETIE